MKRVIKKFFLIISVIVFIFCIIILSKHYSYEKSVNNKYQELSKQIEKLRKEDYSKEKTLPGYVKLQKTNKDIVGWIRISDTMIDYPVLQKDNEYYLSRDYLGKIDHYGSIFIDQRVNLFDLRSKSNVLFYGHNNSGGPMFGTLPKYIDKDYYSKHKIIEFDTLNKREKYEIVFVSLAKALSGIEKGFDYYNYVGNLNWEQYQIYIKRMKDRELYNTDIKSNGDKLITLSTCEYTQENGRLVIVAQKIK